MRDRGQRLPAFHGTHEGLVGQQYVLPADEHGNVVWDANTDTSKTYFMQGHTPRGGRGAEQRAWEWAGSAARSRGGKRPVVLRTNPIGEVDVDHNFLGTGMHWTAPAQEIEDVNYFPPPVNAAMVESSLPGIDWPKYGGSWFRFSGAPQGSARQDRRYPNESNDPEGTPSVDPPPGSLEASTQKHIEIQREMDRKAAIAKTHPRLPFE